MDRKAMVTLLAQHRDEIRGRFATKQLALFGSAARDALRDDSDVDFLVEFDGAATFDRYMDLKFYLEALVQRPVDLVTREAVKPRLRPFIESNLIDVA